MNHDDHENAMIAAAPLAWTYHENSKITGATRVDLGDRLGRHLDDDAESTRFTTSHKTYATSQRIPLNTLRGTPRPTMSLERALRQRRSGREFASRPVTLQQLAALLANALGVTGSVNLANSPANSLTLRAAPSGGALYPIESYVVTRNVKSIEPAAYHYHPVDGMLELVDHNAPDACWQAQYWPDPAMERAACLIVFAARARRTCVKYGERGYRLLLLEAGHMAQNVLLVATALRLSACPLAGFLDDHLARSLQLDPLDEPPLYVIAVGSQT